MGRKIGGSLLLLLGLLLVAGGLVLKFAILPAMAVWPDDVDSTRTYEGTLGVMLNGPALQTMDVANLFYRDVPVRVDRHVTTEQVDGNKALVLEEATMFGPDGSPLQPTQQSWYTIDRKTTEHIPNFTDNTMVQDIRQGLVIGFPIGTEQRAYDGWSDDYQAVVPVEFVAEEEHEGVNTYHFHSASDPAPLTDPAMLAMFPAAIPKQALVGLAPQLDLAPQLLQGLTAMLPLLPDPIPLSYTYGYETHYWVEPTTGVLIDYTKDEARYLSLGGANVPVFQLAYEASDQSIADAKADADDGKSMINLFGTIIPWIAIGVGAVAALGGLYFLLRKRKAEVAAPAAAA